MTCLELHNSVPISFAFQQGNNWGTGKYEKTALESPQTELCENPGGNGFSRKSRSSVLTALWHPAEPLQISSHEKLYKLVLQNKAVESLYTDSSTNTPVKENFYLPCTKTVESSHLLPILPNTFQGLLTCCHIGQKRHWLELWKGRSYLRINDPHGCFISNIFFITTRWSRIKS